MDQPLLLDDIAEIDRWMSLLNFSVEMSVDMKIENLRSVIVDLLTKKKETVDSLLSAYSDGQP